VATTPNGTREGFKEMDNAGRFRSDPATGVARPHGEIPIALSVAKEMMSSNSQTKDSQRCLRRSRKYR
jgi:hypothetical protein